MGATSLRMHILAHDNNMESWYKAQAMPKGRAASSVGTLRTDPEDQSHQINQQKLSNYQVVEARPAELGASGSFAACVQSWQASSTKMPWRMNSCCPFTFPVFGLTVHFSCKAQRAGLRSSVKGSRVKTFSIQRGFQAVRNLLLRWRKLHFNVQTVAACEDS